LVFGDNSIFFFFCFCCLFNFLASATLRRRLETGRTSQRRKNYPKCCLYPSGPSWLSPQRLRNNLVTYVGNVCLCM
jgi:hypothetical protein